MSFETPIKPMLLIACFVIFSASTCSAGAWTAAKGAMYHKLSVNYYTADKRFDSDGNKENVADNGTFTDTNISYYGEYGIFDSLTVIGSLSYKWMENEDDVVISKIDGFSDMDLGLKYRLFSGHGGIFSVQGLVKIPELYDEDDVLSLGNNQYDTEIRLLYGQSLYPKIPGYVNVEAAYRFRAEEPADEIRYLVEFGVDFSADICGRVKLDGIYGMGNEGGRNGGGANPSATFDYDLGKLDAALGWKITPEWGVELGYRPEIYGKNISAGDNWSVSVVYMRP